MHSAAHFCYILYNAWRPSTTYGAARPGSRQAATYNGYTVDPDRRIRQHNCEIKGGARATARLVARAPSSCWEFLAIVSAPQMTHHVGLSLEWHVRYPTCRKPRPSTFQGPEGRLRGLALALAHPKFAHLDPISVYVADPWRATFAETLTTTSRQAGALAERVILCDRKNLVASSVQAATAHPDIYTQADATEATTFNNVVILEDSQCLDQEGGHRHSFVEEGVGSEGGSAGRCDDS